MAPPTTYHTSLLTALDCRGHIHLIIGSSPLAASRAANSLAAGAKPILIAPASATELHYAVSAHVATGSLTHLDRPFKDEDLFTLGRSETGGIVDAVFVTSPRDALAQGVSDVCKQHRIPVNVVDAPALCSFSLLSSHVDGPLQIGVTTNGRGCKLASRIRREVAAALPAGLGSACARLGEMRRRVVDEDRGARRQVARGAQGSDDQGDGVENEGVDDSVDQTASFNKLVTDADADAAKTRRMRWLAQVCEYWPLKRLAAVTDGDVEAILNSYQTTDSSALHNGTLSHEPVSITVPTTGRIILAGSGPGHPDLLTQATYKAIQAADLVLADKLVPSGVLDLIPRRTPVSIARKFPGNADRAQEELLEQALDGVRAGKTVLRLKQGDPFVYGRGGEEVTFFRSHGLGERVTVLPGITSSLSAPLFAGIPVTQRDVSDQMLICTGTGKKGNPPAPPEYVESRTVVFLMALHRIVGLVSELTSYIAEEDGSDELQQQREKLWPLHTPCAVVERASCPDQRIIRTTLRHVADAVEQEGSRPPGLLVVGRACEALYTPEPGCSWTVEDGGFKGLDLDFTSSTCFRVHPTSGKDHTT
ncbi:tetrapyrrole methylase [Lasiosphaeria miniovina]|uniref:Tetrapyrrole methylase n=1 Tax=Lasiosphaeria miniovina TaxID=1954250 RepID=A0AA40BGF2_9PEZI|nr:tetrapyrrole methylase [Lasiosphaeria miniovina]KAK0733754.1 tetrapyrrole methylase [Lasiosphaeria miniovina]